eukprot:99935-Pyramimonas_sp.AAC.1
MAPGRFQGGHIFQNRWIRLILEQTWASSASLIGMLQTPTREGGPIQPRGGAPGATNIAARCRRH